MEVRQLKKPTNLYEILEHIRVRSGMYLGKSNSLEALMNFLTGYQSCMINNHFQEQHKLLPFQYFQSFINQKYKGHSCLHWFGIILLKNENDDEKSFYAFYELLDEFKQIQPISIKKINLTTTHVENYSTYLDENNHKEKEIPDSIYLIEFSNDFGFDSWLVKDGKVMNWSFSYRYQIWNNENDVLEKLERQFGKIEHWETLQGDLMKTMDYLMKIR